MQSIRHQECPYKQHLMHKLPFGQIKIIFLVIVIGGSRATVDWHSLILILVLVSEHRYPINLVYKPYQLSVILLHVLADAL